VLTSGPGQGSRACGSRALVGALSRIAGGESACHAHLVAQGVDREAISQMVDMAVLAVLQLRPGVPSRRQKSQTGASAA